MREPSDKIANKNFVTTYATITNARAEFESKNYCVITWIIERLSIIHGDNGRCKAAKKEFARVAVGSYKFVSLV